VSSEFTRAFSRAAAVHDALLDVAQRKHTEIARLIKRNGEISLENSATTSVVEFFARTVVSQQLASRAARSIWCRVVELAKQMDEPFASLFDGRHNSALRHCGISRSKLKALALMSEAYRSGQISEENLSGASYDEIVHRVTGLWGFGAWSADMVAMFYARLPDVWPGSDAALMRGLRTLVPGRQPARVAICYSPFRTYLARHVWRGLDNGSIAQIAETGRRRVLKGNARA
jgi:3-methyladenine DNA glycosylase/8-oxoguanine DNA glycosylase